MFEAGHDPMRQTKNGFGNNWKPGDANVRGGLQPAEDDSEDEEGVDDEEDDDDEALQEDDEEEGSDHNF
jgi:hypothetical protein